MSTTSTSRELARTTPRDLIRISQLSDDTPVVIATNQRSIAITINDARQWLGAESAPSFEVMKFLMICQARRVDPFLGEAHFFEMGGRWTTVVDISGWIEVAETHPQYDGHECGLVVQQVITPAKPGTKTTPATPAVMGEIRNIEETIRPEGWNVIGGWCRVYRKDRRIPTYRAVSMTEYNRNNRQWIALPHTMIVKVAVVQALAASGIVARNGGYIREELPESQTSSPGDYPGEREGNREDHNDAIDVEIEEVPAIEEVAADQLPSDGDGGDAESPTEIPTENPAAPSQPTLSPDIARELMEALGRSGMTDYEIDCMLARRGVSEINELDDVDARGIISKLNFKWDQEHMGEMLLPDPQDSQPDSQPAVEAGQAIQEGDRGNAEATANETESTESAAPTGEFTEINGDIVNADGEIVGTVLVIDDRVRDIATAHAIWQRANQRHDIVTATGIMESIVEAYGQEALKGWDILSADGPVDPAAEQFAKEFAQDGGQTTDLLDPLDSSDPTASPADSFEISEVPRREERVEPVKQPRKRAKKA